MTMCGGRSTAFAMTTTPYTKAGVAQYELLPWNPGIGREALDRL